jgi:hypothetical protein
MARNARFNGKVAKPMKFGEGMQPGTVEWELKRRREQAQNRREDKAFKKILAEREEMRPKGIWRLLDSVGRFFRTPV